MGDGIVTQRSSWRFDGTVPEKFDRHVERSIPGYSYGHELVVQHASSGLGKGGVIYELGCSTGVLTKKLADCVKPESTRIVGVDQVEDMLVKARARCGGYSNVTFEAADIVDYQFSSADLVVSYYTLQFVPQESRQSVVDKIASVLHPQGALILFEKIRFSDPDFDAEITGKYNAYKRAQGYTDAEIRSKAASLEGVLVPQTESENREMLKHAGFSNVNVIFSELCWQGYVAQI